MKFRNLVDKALEYAIIFFVGVLVADVLWQVLSRYLLTTPSSFTDELAGYLLIWVGLLGAAYVAGKNEHLAIDLLMQKSSGKRKLALQLTINIMILLFALTVMVIGGSWLVFTRFILEVKSAAMQIQLGYIYIALPLSGLIILYYNIDDIRLLLTNNKK